MKKQIFLTQVSLFVSLLMSAQTQITLLHTFDGEVEIIASDQLSFYSSSKYLNGGVYIGNYAYYDYSYQELTYNQGRWYSSKFENNKYTMTFWDKNFQPCGTRTITFPTIENYKVTSWHPANNYTTKFFNDDDDVEILVQYQLTSEYTRGKSYTEYKNYEKKLILIKSNGTIIHDFGNACYISSDSYLYYIDGKWIWTIRKDYYDYSDDSSVYYSQTEVYQIHKQAPTGLQQISAEHLPAYPNPTSSSINIPSGSHHGTRIVNIYDMNGRLVDTRIGEDNGQEININVSNYPSGTYIYQNGDNSGQFIKR